MPSQRKRIGFLPRTEIQNIIDKICKHNKLSQSKVTGILVEEALTLRGVLNPARYYELAKLKGNSYESLNIPNECFYSEKQKNKESLNSGKIDNKEEIQMIYDYIEFKFFKNIMNNKKLNY